MKRYLLPLVFLGFISSAYAAPESICPGGSSPRADVFKCFDFDNLGSCNTGYEDACFQANGFDRNPSQLLGKITREGTAAVGNGYLQLETTFGSTGGGYYGVSFEGERYAEFSARFYMRYDPSYVNYNQGPHGFRFSLSPDSGSCYMACTIETLQDRFYTYCTRTAPCGSFDGEYLPLIENGIFNGVWHEIEFRAKVDTACTDPSKLLGCNGVLEVYRDGERTYYTDKFNWGGTQFGQKFSGVQPFRMYYHARIPRWEPGIAFDNLVLSNSVNGIGPAVSENPPGVALNTHPYYLRSGVEPFFSDDGSKTYHMNGDCTSPPNSSKAAYTSGAKNESYFSHSTDVSRRMFNWASISSCIPEKFDMSRDSSLKLELPANGDDAGIFYSLQEIVGNNKHYCRGSVLFPNVSVVSTLNLVAGYNRYQSALGGGIGGYVGLGFNGNKFAAVYRDRDVNGGTRLVLNSTSKSPVSNQWYDFEIEYDYGASTMSLWMDGEWLIEDQIVPAFYNQERLPSCMFGVADYEGPGATYYFDNIGYSTVSFRSCKGWHNDCPFDGDGNVVEVIPPSPPSGSGPLSPPGPVSVTETN